MLYYRPATNWQHPLNENLTCFTARQSSLLIIQQTANIVLLGETKLRPSMAMIVSLEPLPWAWFQILDTAAVTFLKDYEQLWRWSLSVISLFFQIQVFASQFAQQHQSVAGQRQSAMSANHGLPVNLLPSAVGLFGGFNALMKDPTGADVGTSNGGSPAGSVGAANAVCLLSRSHAHAPHWCI